MTTDIRPSRPPRPYERDLRREASPATRAFLTRLSLVALGEEYVAPPAFTDDLQEQYDSLDARLAHRYQGELRLQFKIRYKKWWDFLLELAHTRPGQPRATLGWGLEIAFEELELDYLVYAWEPYQAALWFPYPALAAVVRQDLGRWLAVANANRRRGRQECGIYYPARPASTVKAGRLHKTLNLALPNGGPVQEGRRGLVDRVTQRIAQEPGLDPCGRGVIHVQL